MTAHTPLPWHHSKKDGKPDQIIGADGSLICEGVEWNDNGQANARLIAAAPELLGEVQTDLQWIENLLGDIAAGRPLRSASISECLKLRRDDLRAAIAKAKEATS